MAFDEQRLRISVNARWPPCFGGPLELLYLDNDGNFSSLDNVVPAPMREEVNETDQPLELAGHANAERCRCGPRSQT